MGFGTWQFIFAAMNAPFPGKKFSVRTVSVLPLDESAWLRGFLWNISTHALSNEKKEERKEPLNSYATTFYISPQSDEAELLLSCRAGAAQAVAALVHRYESQIARTIYGILGDCPEGEDIGQEVFIRFFNNLPRFRGECSLTTYLTRIAINLSLNELKRRRRKKGLFSESMEEAGRITEEESNRVEWNELQECIGRALQKLPDKYRLVVVLRLMEGRSIRETAEILKTAEGTVMSRLARAQQLLRKELQPLLGEFNE